MISTIVKENKISQSRLFPATFFPSWQGVLTLAYSGFSPELTRLKSIVKVNIADLKAENEGSKWPKTTIAALRDGENLKREDFDEIVSICNSLEEGGRFKEAVVEIEKLSVVLFACRSLERILEERIIDLKETQDGAKPDKSEKEYVSGPKVLGQLINIDDYWKNRILLPGNRRYHYTTSHVETTLVSFLKYGKNQNCIKLINDFRNSLSDILRDKYYWFDEGSFHITIRSLT
jgi:hypothetical protein